MKKNAKLNCIDKILLMKKKTNAVINLLISKH